MDEPAQKFQTKHGLNVNPHWDESFDFDLTSASEEILFEIYEGSSDPPIGHVGYSGQNKPENGRFLGLAIVSLDEVRHSNVDTAHILKLQGRPYRNDMITGNLTVEFDFYYDSMGHSTGKDMDQTALRNGVTQFRESSTRRPIYDPSDSFGAYDNHNVISTNTTTVTVKNIPQQSNETQPLTGTSGITTVQQTSTTPVVKILQPNVSNATTSQVQQHVLPGSSTGTTSGTQHFSTGTRDLHITDMDDYPCHRYDNQEANGLMKTKSDEMPQKKAVDEVRQSRGQVKMRNEEKAGRKRDRSFFSELRERLSGRRRSKRRAKSCDLAAGEMEEETVSLPPSRDVSRTRFSEKSGSRHDLRTYGGDKSDRSTKSLYQHSTLLLEINENGQKRYYLVPHVILDEPGITKLLRQGKKLHVHNDHTFVAVKSRSGTVCNVCHERIGRSNFTKQAYQCRGE
uniref:C2 domain-containing protein n=1 Tax=Elaeophora elaphi TaxID=1147741 RepID=A0A0R3RGZ6_9BILA